MSSENENMQEDELFHSKESKSSSCLRAIKEESKEYDVDVMDVRKSFGK